MLHNEDYLKAAIYWQNHEMNHRYFFAYADGVLLLLRMNDFPDEPLLTLINGLEIMDIDDVPPDWIIPF